MKQASLSFLVTIKDSSGTIIDEAILDRSRAFGRLIQKCTEPTYFKYTPLQIGLNGFAEIVLEESPATPPCSQGNTYAESSSRNLIGFVKKYSAAILISLSLWAIPLYGLYAVERVS